MISTPAIASHKLISKETLTLFWQNQLPYLTSHRIQAYLPFPSRHSSIQLHHLHNSYTHNYLKKVIRHPYTRNYVLLVGPEMTFYKLKECHEVLNKQLDEMNERAFEKHRNKSSKELFNLWRKTQIENNEIRSRLRVLVDYDGKLRLKGEPPQVDGLLSIPTNQFIQLPEVNKKDLLLPVNKVLGLHSANQYSKQGVMVEALGQKLYPKPGVFLPTNDTIYNLFSKYLDSRLSTLAACKRAIDIGCGTGVLACMIGKRLKKSDLTVADISEKALQCAEMNCEIVLKRGCWPVHMDITALKQTAGEQYDLIVSNPPWLPVAKLAESQFQMGCYDKKGHFLQKLLNFASQHLSRSGVLVILYSDLACQLDLQSLDWVEHACKKHGLLLRQRMEANYRTKVGGRFDPLKSIKNNSKVQLIQMSKVNE